MRVTNVSLTQTKAAKKAKRPALAPELLAAVGARYSRNNEGLDKILTMVDTKNPEISIDPIFNLIDFGHRSIADMVPVALFIDEITIMAAFIIWNRCQTTAGMESSTRYIRASTADLINPMELGFGLKHSTEIEERSRQALTLYAHLIEEWKRVAMMSPNRLRLGGEKIKAKKRERITRNFAFDRARYAIPVIAKTNMVMVMSARAWADLCVFLSSTKIPELENIASSIRDELELTAPRLIRHSYHSDNYERGFTRELLMMAKDARKPRSKTTGKDRVKVEVFGDTQVSAEHSLGFHDNRYDWVGSELARTGVQFKFPAVTIAEARDLNRHRTGTRHINFAPVGFYCAEDQVFPNDDIQAIKGVRRVGDEATLAGYELMKEGNPLFMYCFLLGTQIGFEHLTTGDKFLYEVELRTGLGAHYKYAGLMAMAAREFGKQVHIDMDKYIGKAEPE